MDNLVIERTEATPDIYFNATTNILSIQGESYPENAAEFYAPIFKWLREFLTYPSASTVVANIEIVYFNSSSSKALMNLFDLLDEACARGKPIVVNWIYDTDNESALEYGEEFKEDVKQIEFNLVVK